MKFNDIKVNVKTLRDFWQFEDFKRNFAKEIELIEKKCQENFLPCIQQIHKKTHKNCSA